ncbi:Phosphofructokinase family protein [Tritrichomonas foetus]|uniref:6-phosphofructokinase n=1 Tax=Tritrichomonas foetus TaxID=1144522 RepID=A0A1J4JFP6_9EUKA|nr:Phosphofructokinase family protein [Tritrichomonas foetus]|eukprot:OHS97970.1 Phosphofructokinase family protein [Tritrichomonas foetus]
MKRIAVLSSGTDNAGINSAIRAIVRTGITGGAQVFGIESGFRGLVEDRIFKLSSRDVSGKIGKPGCFLGSSKPTYLDNPTKITKALANLNKKSIEGLIVIGGGGTFATAMKLTGDLPINNSNSIGAIQNGIRVIGIPSTVQDDIVGTDICLGVDTAVNNIMNCVDHIRSCDSSRNRSFLVEVEGRDSGSLAMRAAIVCGAEVVLTPEISTKSDKDFEELVNQIESFSNSGKTQCICLVSRGWKPGIKTLTQFLTEKMGESDVGIRETILGHIQRGGSPSANDRLLGTSFGSNATKALLEGHTGEFVALQKNHVALVPISETIGKVKAVNQQSEALFKVTNTSTCD